MRIISGKYKGRTIKMPKAIRPTQDKIRKAFFDILGDIQGLSFLELFAGSGAIGLEAISQGARQVVFVEKDIRCVNIIKENLGILDARYCLPAGKAGILDKKPESRIQDQVSLLQLDALIAIKQLEKAKNQFDIIFLDPPYYQDLVKKTLQILGAYDILTPNGLITVQHFKKDNLPNQLGDLVLFKQTRYGDTLLSFYRKLTRNQ